VIATEPGPRVGAGLILAVTLVVGALALAGCGSSSHSASGQASRAITSSQGSGTTGSAVASGGSQANDPLGPEGVLLERGPQLAPASTTTQGAAVDGIECAPVEQLAYHIHAHLQVYVQGQPTAIPGAIGLVGPVAQQTNAGPFYGAAGCYYWLHTHTSDGVIHIESPTQRIYTLGDFFKEWRQPLSSSRVADATGHVAAFINGARWTKSPTTLPLLPHAVIQLDVGSPIVPFAPVSWAETGL
jgi:hypothetical protein